MKIQPPKSMASSVLLGGGIAGGFALVGAAVARVNAQNNPSLLGPSYDTVVGAAEGTALAAIVGLGAAIFAPKWRTVGLGMVGTFGTAWAGSAVLKLFNPSAGPQGYLTQGRNYQVVLQSGTTVIERIAVGDSVTILAPQGWTVPSIQSSGPGVFLNLVASDATSSSATYQAVAAGSANLTSRSAGTESGTVTIDAS